MSTEVTIQIKSCHCSITDGPHIHVDDRTIIPWDEFCRSFKEYRKQAKQSVVIQKDLKLANFSLVIEEQLVNKHCCISISSKLKKD